ncbi:unnamed protein product [Prorocentrum cordatum]|uniref:Uncharacterized protein n=1 Tax=Prorocentrum cordatum TaxID=2364126 RepID=A0ABN9UNT8_9DINO|nr:unnamed protein product [Polarella glacialis]
MFLPGQPSNHLVREIGGDPLVRAQLREASSAVTSESPEGFNDFEFDVRAWKKYVAERPYGSAVLAAAWLLGVRGLPAEPGRGVAAFAARDLAASELVLEERAGRLGAFEPAGHLGALCALRALGPRRCREAVLTKTRTTGDPAALPSEGDARREARVLRAALGEGLVPPEASQLTPAESTRGCGGSSSSTASASTGRWRRATPGTTWARSSSTTSAASTTRARRTSASTSGGRAAGHRGQPRDRHARGRHGRGELRISYLPREPPLSAAERRRQLLELPGGR